MPHFEHCVLAPAFPFQGRITRDGRQLARDGDHWRDTGVDLAAALRATASRCRMRDAETDADLDAIVAGGRRLPGRVLWCGTGGLAGALAGRRAVPCPPLARPFLALIGSDHPVSAAQLAAGAPAASPAARSTRRRSPPAGNRRRGGIRRPARRHPPRGRLPPHCRMFAALLGAIERPGTLVVAGGETLRGLCDALGAARLEVDGEIEPGVPTSLLRGGAWDGQRIVSKSGAFGDPGFLARLLAV